MKRERLAGTRAAVILLLVHVASPIVSAQRLASPTTISEEASAVASRTLLVPRVMMAPTLGSPWENQELSNGVAVVDFRQKQPADGAPVSLPTVAYVSYDDLNLYVIFNCTDTADHVRAGLAKRENIADDDQVMVYLDTFGDQRRAYVFAVNPLGVQRDGILTEGQDTDYSFDAVWRSEAKHTDTGFQVLIAIPFKSLRFSNDAVQSWGIALGRYIARTSEYSYWPYITSRVAGFVNQMAKLDGIRQVSPGHNVQFVPYGAFTGSRYLDTKTPAFASSNEMRGGLDSKVVLRDAFTLDATFNPDFSQVESDDPQVTVNKRYEVFFPEKRPFFTENAGFFATPEELLFSRRIIDPQMGARLSGKAGPWAIGALVTDDRAQGASYPANSPFAGRRVFAAATRVQREVGKESFVGVLVANRTFASSGNRVLSFDTRLKLNPNWTLTAQAVRSYDQAPDGGRTDGSALNAKIARDGRHLSYSSSYLQRSPGFNAELGFIERIDLRKTSHFVSYYWRPENSPLMSFGPSLSVSSDWDYRSRLQDWYVGPQFDFFFRRQYGVSLYRTQSYEFFQGVAFREYFNTISAYSARSKRVSLKGSFAWGTSPNYSPPDGVPPFLGQSTTASFGITYRPAQRLRIDESYYYTNFNLLTAGSAAGSEPNRIFTNHITQTKINFQFTRELSFRAILDYNSLVPRPSLIQYDLDKRITGDFLLTYLLNPFTAVYVGYTDKFQNLNLDASSPPSLRITGSPSTRTARQIFVKVSYRIGF